VNRQWCLVHATHLSESERTDMARSGAVAGLCPTTEANLGDGFFPLKAYLDSGGSIAVGSDSHSSVSPIEEMRWLEYGQRLLSQSRNVVSTRDSPHAGSSIVQRVLGGGADAMGANIGAISVGYRADIVVLDGNSPDMAFKAREHILDTAVFGGNSNNFRHVMSGGQWLVENYIHIREDVIGRRYRALMADLADRL
jgi:formimidoylglutamate deiminase